mmetsp:Transcript_169194/g.543914  ORF Transcript_169194/g.543914 Transcript_169194/m.543914 type:complete len:1311 (+) Transcript_169194:84-4016(+)
MSWAQGTPCWARDPEEAFVKATIVSVSGKAAKVQVASPENGSEERTCSVEELLTRSHGSERTAPEMDDLPELHMASILHNVESLFGQRQASRPGQGVSTIYSSVGPMLIAMNPFAPLPIYGEDWVRAYRGASGNAAASRALGPHCYRTAEEAYAKLRDQKVQSIVICGESGAGKTVTSRYMLQYLCKVAGVEGENQHLAEEIMKANVLLESFGNAKTTRNDNSSRFGRYTKLFFDAQKGYKIMGCNVDHYLLERSRVVSHMETERSYHIFYMMLESGSGSEYQLSGGVEDYLYTRSSAKVKDRDDKEEFKDLLDAMTKAGFGSEMQKQILQGVAAVLLLGNVEFSGQDKAELNGNTQEYLAHASKLLGVREDALAKALSKRPRTFQGEEIWTDISVKAAQGQRDTVAKTVYSRIFDNIVGFISQKLGSESDKTGGQDRAVTGLLDIFGFEDLAKNGFEQMFINLTNERIQHLFNTIMFEKELEAYEAEGIEATFDPGCNNLKCVMLFTSPRPPGVIKLLSDFSKLQSSTEDVNFVKTLNQSFSKHNNFLACDPQTVNAVLAAKGLRTKGKGAFLDYRECFQVKHYAATVLYTVNDWAAKSIDALLPHLAQVMQSSTKPFVKALFSLEAREGGGADKGETVGEKFKDQLEALATTLEEGQTTFVRCIKSNPEMRPGYVKRKEVLEQLVHGGVVAALEMRQRGLPDRLDYEEFCGVYEMLEPASTHRRKGVVMCDDDSESSRQRKKHFKVRCEKMLTNLFGEQGKLNAEFAFGHSKVFMKSHVNALLRAAVGLRRTNLAKLVQRRWRVHFGNERIRKIDEAREILEEVGVLAKEHGVAELRGVRQALEGASGKIQPLVDTLQALRKEHDHDTKKIGPKLPSDKVAALHRVVEELCAAVDKVVQRRAEAQQLLSARLQRSMLGVVKLLERVDLLAGQCRELADVVEKEELDKCMNGCSDAKAFLERLQSKDLLELKSAGPVGVDFEAEGKIDEDRISPQATALMEQAHEIVARAEQIGDELLRVKRQFQQAVQEEQGKQEAAREALQKLQEKAQKCIEEGMEDIVALVATAWERQQEAEDVLLAAKDADGYRSAVTAFVAAVAGAKDGVERGDEELQRRAAENEKRRELQSQLDDVQGKLEQKKKAIHEALEMRMEGAESATTPEMSKNMDALLNDILTLRGGHERETFEVWQAKVEACVKDAQLTIQTVGATIDKDSKARKQAFQDRLNVLERRTSVTPQKTTGGPDLNPLDLIRDKYAAHEAELQTILKAMEKLHEDGLSNNDMRLCVNNFMRSTWGPASSGGYPGRRLFD